VAHDFNNLLTAILGFTDVLLDGRPASDPAAGPLAEIRKAGERAAALTGQLLAFSRHQALESKVLDLNPVVAGLEGLLRRLIGEDVDLRVRLGRDAGAVRADPAQLEQVVVNLAVNARDAMPRGGRLEIVTRAAPAAGGAGPRAVLEVTDTGVGMDAATRARIFEPFFTTKELGKGTGLGLATVYGIVKQFGGTVDVESAPGRGTTFRVALPQHRPVPAGADGPAPRAPDGGRETVLLVEDDDAIRSVVRTVLQRTGYTVLAAGTGAEALRLSAGHAGPVDLLITDVVMPGMNGRELADRLAAARAGLRVLFMSGYTDDAVLRHDVLAERVPFLHKPFLPDVLARKVRDVLDQSAEC
jgi:CheY-like chemotaxis protein